MKNAVIAASLCAVLAACGPDRPNPGEAPGWPPADPPRASHSIPLPMHDHYMAPTAHRIHEMPPVPDGHNAPYAVRGQGASEAGAVPGGPVAGASPTPACIKVPPAVHDGKPTSTLCPQPDGSWTFIPD